MKKLLLLLLTVVSTIAFAHDLKPQKNSILSGSQSHDVTIGSGTSTNAYLPTYSYFKYSFTEQIYTAAEIGESGVITAVSFKVSNSKSATRKVDLYLKSTTMTTFPSKTGWEPLPSSAKVYSGNVTFSASGWTTITLTTPFVYDGTSNLVVGMDDNTGSYVSSSSNCPKFYVYSTGENRALRIYGDNNNYNPAAPSTYSGSYIKSNDQIMFTMNPIGGGSVNYFNVTAVANPEEAGTVTGAGTFEEGSSITLSAIANEGYEFVNWTKDDVEVSTNADFTLTVTEDADYEANFERIIIPTFDIIVADVSNGVISADKTSAAVGETVTLTATPYYGCVFSHWIVYETGNINNTVGVNNNKFIMPASDVTVAALITSSTGAGNVVTDVTIGSGTNTSSYLPTYTYYKYSFTEQIYTAAEIGQEGTITAVAFKVANSKSATRNLDIYMKTTTKFAFTSRTGWETLASSDMVFSGTVTFNASGWTVIMLNTPFAYDGISNLLIGVDDNTGSYVSGSSNSPKFYVYSTKANRAMRIYSDNTNYNPSAPNSYSGTYLTSSNQIQFTMITSDGTTTNNENLFVTPDALSDFSYVYGNGPSEVQSFAVIGADLNNAITVTAPADYEICTTPDGTYDNTITFDGSKGNRDGTLTWDFEEGSMDGWVTVDADGDGHDWQFASVLMEGYTITPNSGEDMLSSESYDFDASLPLTPDNWLISPIVPLGGTFTMYACSQDAEYPNEHFGVFVSTSSDLDIATFTMVNEWTITINREESPWGLYTVDLSAYAGQTGYVAVRHFNCTDQFYLNVDNFSLTCFDYPVIPDPIHIDYLTANVYVRLKAGLEQGVHNGEITVTSGDNTATVTLNGMVTNSRTGIDFKTAETIKNIGVYPNPIAHGESFRIAVPEDVNLDAAKVEVYNELGALVHAEVFTGDVIPNDFAAGLYTIRIIDTKGNVYHSKLIVR